MLQNKSIVISLYVLTLLVTFWLFNYQITPELAGWGITLFFVILAESVLYLYFACLLSKRIHDSIHVALWPAIGVIVTAYVFLCAASMAAFYSGSYFSITGYISWMIILSLIVLSVVGAVLVLNNHVRR